MPSPKVGWGWMTPASSPAVIPRLIASASSPIIDVYKRQPYDIAFPEAVLEDACHLAEDMVSLHMAVGIINCFEFINIHQNQRPGASVSQLVQTLLDLSLIHI